MKIHVEARRLLHDAASALEGECEAAGEDEVKANPHFRGYQRIAARIRRYLARHPPRQFGR
jgi:hypothetical protein